MNNEILIKGVSGRLSDNGVVELNLEHVARGLGFVESKFATNGESVEYVMWRRVRQYLTEFGFDTCAENEYIPENIFYKLCFKASNETARAFQDLVTDEILPSIRKTGMYSVNNISRKELAKMLFESEEEKERLQLQNQQQQKKIELQRPKVELVDRILETDELVDMGQAAKLLGLGFGRNTLLKKLREKGIFFTNRNEPKQYYIDRGYFELKERFIERENHEGFMVVTPYASQRGIGYLSTVFDVVPKSKKRAKISVTRKEVL